MISKWGREKQAECRINNISISSGIKSSASSVEIIHSVGLLVCCWLSGTRLFT